MNENLPPIKIYVRNSFIIENGIGFSEGRLIGVRSLQNQALQFQVLLETGALFTGLPANALCFKQNDKERSLIECQMWDSISSEIQVFQFNTLLYMPCSLKLTTNEIINGHYLFSIDYIGNEDLSRDPTEWKMFHAIESEEGNLHLYPQYRIKFMDTALCPNHENDLPKYKYNINKWIVGS